MRYPKKYKFYEMLKLVVEEKRKFRLPAWDYHECVWLQKGGFLENYVMTNENFKLENHDIRGCVAIPYIPTKYELMSTEWIEVE